MNNDKSKSDPKPGEAKTKPPLPGPAPIAPKTATPTASGPRFALFRRIDWVTFGLTTLLTFIGYYLTLAPDLTLEDSGELAVGSFYAGVPHPPGYPVWTLYTWLFTLIPYSNIAWRVALSSAVAAAFACGLLALMVSRGSSLLLEGIAEFKLIERRWENVLCLVSGFVAGMLLGFNGFMWSQAVIVEVYTLSVLSFMAVLCCLFRWIYAPEQRRYLYWAFFWFGICFTNHQTLIVAAMGIEILIMAVQPKLGRDLFVGNSIVYLLGIVAKAAGVLTAFDSNPPLFVIYNLVGVGSITLVIWLSIRLRVTFAVWEALFRDLLFALGVVYLLALVLNQMEVIALSRRSGFIAHLIGLGALALCGRITYQVSKANLKSLSAAAKVLLFFAGGYVLILMLASFRSAVFLRQNLPLFYTFHAVGAGLLVSSLAFFIRRTELGSELKFISGLAAVWILGASFYFYMPLASMTNPPLNWGYPRTVEGFKHALTRGQYEQTNPTSSIGRFVEQIWMYGEGAYDEFTPVYLLIGLVPFLFYQRMQKRERAWLIGLTAIGLFLSVLLLILLNPNTDMQSRQQARVFFTASHIIVAIAIGYGVTLIGGVLAAEYQRYRFVILCSGAVAAAIELYHLVSTFDKTQFPLMRFSAVLGLASAAVFILALLGARHRPILPVLIAVFALTPARSILSHWAPNEQRGHLFGYWFGHDMFTPPFGIYPEMARNAILYGGTDPGRFNPTYMIFCESFIPAKHKPHDPNFDRRDVYLITQNALADKTYLDYIRAHYNRSAQVDPYFFSDLVRTEKERVEGRTNLLARALLPLDRYFTDLGDRIERRRRAEGVYPPKEILTPTNEDSQQAFHEYINDAARRLAHDRQFPNEPKQVKPGEGVSFTEDNRVQVSGQVAVMSINGLLTKVIFDKNPESEFYVEESFPLDWMFPHLTPFGIIMKINRQPVPALTEGMMSKDHEFWSKYSERLIGNWVTYDTSVKEICDFAEKTYLRHDFTGFKGDRKFARDDFARKAFSKLRSAIGWLYWWRVSHECPPELRPKDLADQQRLMKEAEFSLKQSYAFCPYSPEALHKYVTLLLGAGRVDEAFMIAETSLKFDPDSPVFQSYANQLRGMRGNQSQLMQAQTQFAQLEQQFRSNPTNLQLGLQLATAYIQMQQGEAAVPLLEQVAASPQADVSVMLQAVQLFAQVGRRPQLEAALQKIKPLLAPLQKQYEADTNNAALARQLVSAYLLTQQTNLAVSLVDQLVSGPQATAETLLDAAQVYNQVHDRSKLEGTLQKLVAIMPTSPEAWYDLAAVQVTLGKSPEAIASLKKAMQLSQTRFTNQAGAKDLRPELAVDPRFAPIRQWPEFQQMLK